MEFSGLRQFWVKIRWMVVGDPRFQSDQSPLLDEEVMTDLSLRVRAAVRRSCPSFLAAQADDIAQDVLVQLMKKLEKNEGNVTFSSIYLLKAAHGMTVDEIRRRSRRREQTGMGDAMVEKQLLAPDPERATMGRSLGQEIRQCLEGIVPARRTAVTLRLLGCPVSEVARRLGCPEKSAENRVWRGMKNLRECLAAKGLKP
jgi:RNA polymerase sigma factor (sigma-70 family)